MGNTPPRGPMDADIHGAISISVAISPIFADKKYLLRLEWIVRSTMVYVESGAGRIISGVGPVRSGLRICREISGNGAAISLSNTNRPRRLIRTGPRAEPNAFIAAAVGKSRFASLRHDHSQRQTSRISPATIWVSGSSANANPEGFRS